MTLANGYRLGLDIGANSIGWCVLSLGPNREPTGLVDLGTRILTASEEAGRDPQTGASLAVDRRVARGMRRRRDRYLLRKNDLMAALIASGLMPAEEHARKVLEKIDPYEVRATALDQPVPLHHFGRALFHLHQRRGFKSNRKSDRRDAEAGMIRHGIDNLKVNMSEEGARTIGEFLARRHAERQSTRARIRGSGKDAHFPFYLDRALLEDEFRIIWDRQAPHHKALTDALRIELQGIMFRQRPLRDVVPGRCALYPDTDHRAPRALPEAQRFRILKELSNLRIRTIGTAERPITIAERDILLAKLLGAGKLSFEQMRRALKLSPQARFNLESERRKDLKGDETAERLASKKGLGKSWRNLPMDQQSAIVEALLDAEDEDTLRDHLRELLDGDSQAADALLAAPPLPEGHAHYGRTALRQLVATMEAGDREYVAPDTGEVSRRPVREDEAVADLGFHHSDHRPTRQLPRLPYYGAVLTDAVVGTGEPTDPLELRYGRLPNPTVHIAMNQLRRVVNAIAARYGAPVEIVLEMARELKLSREEKARIERQYVENQRENDRRRAVLANLGQPDSGINRLLLRLYDELPAEDKLCVYSGRPIGVEQLFSSAVEIDHILPFSRTLDDSFGNKVLCFREANRGKRNRSPSQAFRDDELAEIRERARHLFPAPKAQRFDPDAMARFEDSGFQLPRRLTDTQYMARLARQYLGHVCDPNAVWATNGRLTAMLRGKWGLNSLLPDHNFAATGQPKNRRDHRHHAIDAFVIAVTDRSLINRLSRAAGRAEEHELDRVLEDMPEPFAGFRAALDECLQRTVVSHRPDHGIQGKLHEETAYGTVTEAERAEGWTVAYRKPADTLTANEIRRIRDRDLREAAERVLDNQGEEAVRTHLERQGIRRVRLLKKEDASTLVTVRHGADSRHTKFYVAGANHHVDIYEAADGKWHGEGVSVYLANQPDHLPAWYASGAHLVMRLHKGDLVEVEHDGVRKIMRVYRLEPSNNRIRLAGHNEAGALDKRHNDPDDPFRWYLAGYSSLKSGGARRVRVDEIGQVYPATEMK